MRCASLDSYSDSASVGRERAPQIAVTRRSPSHFVVQVVLTLRTQWPSRSHCRWHIQRRTQCRNRCPCLPAGWNRKQDQRSSGQLGAQQIGRRLGVFSSVGLAASGWLAVGCPEPCELYHLLSRYVRVGRRDSPVSLRLTVRRITRYFTLQIIGFRYHDGAG
jgi:hypothetical protein